MVPDTSRGPDSMLCPRRRVALIRVNENARAGPKMKS
jgi:hypothetical protein